MIEFLYERLLAWNVLMRSQISPTQKARRGEAGGLSCLLLLS